MSENLFIKVPDDQAEDYAYVLRVFNQGGNMLVAVDRVGWDDKLSSYVGYRGHRDVPVAVFSRDLSFTMNLRSDFRGLTNLEMYEEQLEDQVEAVKFKDNANKIMGHDKDKGYE